MSNCSAVTVCCRKPITGTYRGGGGKTGAAADRPRRPVPARESTARCSNRASGTTIRPTGGSAAAASPVPTLRQRRPQQAETEKVCRYRLQHVFTALPNGRVGGASRRFISRWFRRPVRTSIRLPTTDGHRRTIGHGETSAVPPPAPAGAGVVRRGRLIPTLSDGTPVRRAVPGLKSGLDLQPME